MDNRFPWLEFPHDRVVFTGCNTDQTAEVRRIGLDVCTRVGNSLNWTWNSRNKSVCFHYGDDVTVSAGAFPLFADGVGAKAEQFELDEMVRMIRSANRSRAEKDRVAAAAEKKAESDKKSAMERQVSDAMPDFRDGLAFKDRARRGMKKLILPGGDK